MPFALTNDKTRIYYDSVGHADAAVILVQGIGLSSRFWFSIPQQLASDPVRPWRVIALDNRGSGRSDTPRRPWSMRTMADDVIAVMNDAGLRSAHVVGLSMGGMIAQHVAIRYPERIDGLVLLATCPGMPHARLADLSTVYKMSTLPISGGKGISSLTELLLPPEAPAALLKDWPAALRAEGKNPHGFFRQLAAVCTHITPLSLGKIRCPTIVVAGADDKVVPPANATCLARKIPRSQLRILNNCAHAVHSSEPDIVARCLRELPH